MSSKKDLNSRLKKMKSSIEENKHILNEEIPEDVTHSGSTDLIKSPDQNEEEEKCQKEKK